MEALGVGVSRLLWSYYQGPDHPAKIRIWNAFRTFTGYPSLTVPYCGGTISLDERDLVQRDVLTTGFYEPEVWEELFAHATGDEIVWDVGAHVGTFSVRAMLDPRVAEFCAFEPDPITRVALRRNLSQNSSRGSRWRLVPLAMGDAAGEAVIYRGPSENLGLSSLSSHPTSDAHKVEITTVDTLVFDGGYRAPSLIKIDVEGFEAGVLAGASRTLRERPPKAIVLEAEANPDGSLKEPNIGDRLHNAGFDLRRLRRPSGLIDTRENYLATPR